MLAESGRKKSDAHFEDDETVDMERDDRISGQRGYQGTEPEERGGIFYMSIPNEDGTFNASSASPTYREGASIYKFRKISDDQAKFRDRRNRNRC